MSAILETEGLSKSFGGVHAVRDLDLSVPQGALFALIGPNGAGKTTVINLLTGLLRATAGRVRFEGREITNAASHRVAAAGIARTYQNGRLFQRLTVLENVLVGASYRMPRSVWSAVLRGRAYRARAEALRADARRLLGELGLADAADRPVTSLPFGRQRMVELARALVSAPRLLLLDEPAAGLNSAEVEQLRAELERLRGRGVTILLIEHNMGLVMRVADRIAVINFGEKIAEGAPAEIRADPKVLEAYLGRGYRHAAV